MPPDAKDVLRTTFDVSRETMERLETYEVILREWSLRLSLVSRTTLDNVWERHFLDSAQLLPWIAGKRVLDVGTGAGFPGMILAILGAPDIHLSENNQQKIAFLRHVADQTGTNVTIHNTKAETLANSGAGIVTARAVAPLTQLLAMSSGLFAHGAEGLFLKGRNASVEVEAARKHWSFELETAQSMTSPESSILHLKQIRPRK